MVLAAAVTNIPACIISLWWGFSQVKAFSASPPQQFDEVKTCTEDFVMMKNHFVEYIDG